jgi:hypothetical protein
LLPVFLYQRLGSVNTAATAAANRELHLDVAQAAGAFIHRMANLTIGNSVTDADVHGLHHPPAVPDPN